MIEYKTCAHFQDGSCVRTGSTNTVSSCADCEDYEYKPISDNGDLINKSEVMKSVSLKFKSVIKLINNTAPQLSCMITALRDGTIKTIDEQPLAKPEEQIALLLPTTNVDEKGMRSYECSKCHRVTRVYDEVINKVIKSNPYCSGCGAKRRLDRTTANKPDCAMWVVARPFMTDTEECSKCHYEIPTSELRTPHCPWCGRMMTNYGEDED